MARKPRPPGVPDEAWWSAKDKEWVLGAKDARGRLRGLVRYWRADGSLVSECEHRRGVPHGAARRFYEDGTRFQTCTYVDGKLHGPRTFYPARGPTAEPPLPGWAGVGESVAAYRVHYDRGDIVGTGYVTARGREVQQDGRPIPRRPRGVPATASPMPGGWLEMRRREVEGDPRGEVVLTREYRRDGALHRERRGLESWEYHANGVLHEHGKRIVVGPSHVRHGSWAWFDEEGVPRRESVYARGVEQERTWLLAAGEHPDRARRRSGPIAQGMWAPERREGTLEHGVWAVKDGRGRTVARVELGPPLTDAQVLELPALAEDAADEDLEAIAESRTEAVHVLDGLCARLRLAGRGDSRDRLTGRGDSRDRLTGRGDSRERLAGRGDSRDRRAGRGGSRERLTGALGRAAPWTEWSLDAEHVPLAERARRHDGPPLMEILHGLTWGAPPAGVLEVLAAMLHRRDRPRVALDLVRAATLFADSPALRTAAAGYLRDLGDDAGADEVLAAAPDRVGPDEERLLAAIRDAAPDDDQPRLVYADWLLQRGEPRGELINTQCALARTAAGAPGRAALERRVKALLAVHRARWCAGIEGLEDCAFERGFLSEGWSVPAGAVVQHADPLWRLAPFRQIRIDRVRESMAQLATCPALGRYRALSFYETVIDTDEVARLARCPYLAALEELAFDDCSLDDAGLIALAGSPHLGRLRALDIGGRDNDFGIAGFRALAGAAFAPRLESLLVRQRWLGEEAADVLAAFPALTELELRCNSLGDAGITRLAALPLGLESLGLYMNDIGAAGARALAGSPILDAVHTLDVSANPMGESGGVALVGSPHLRALRRLTYGGQDGIPNAAVAAAIARSLPGLEHLGLSLAQIGPDGAAALAAGHFARLDSLALHNNAIGDAGASALARSTTLPALRWLDVSNNGLTDAGAIAIAESPHLPALRHLLIGGTPLGPKAVGALRDRFGAGVALKNTWER